MVFYKFCKYGEYMKKKKNLMVDLSKFTFNKKKVLNRVVAIGYNQVCNQILSKLFQGLCTMDYI